MRRLILGTFGALSILLSGTGFSATARAEAPTVAGLWLDNEGKAAVEISRCDKGMCGKIVWLKDPADPAGKAWMDILNPDVSKRTTPICGLPVIGDLKRQTNGEWTEGWIYDPEQGKRFSVELSLKDDKTLNVLGFEKERVRSELLLWTRLPDNAPRCK